MGIVGIVGYARVYVSCQIMTMTPLYVIVKGKNDAFVTHLSLIMLDRTLFNSISIFYIITILYIS